MNESILLKKILELLGDPPMIPYEHIESEAVQNFVYENQEQIKNHTGQYTPRPLDCLARTLPVFGLQLKSVTGVWSGRGAVYVITKLVEDEDSYYEKESEEHDEQ